MKEKTLQYNCGSSIVSIVVEDMGKGVLWFPSFKPLPSVPQSSFLHSSFSNMGEKPALSTSCGEQELNGDLLRLMPESLGGQYF